MAFVTAMAATTERIRLRDIRFCIEVTKYIKRADDDEMRTRTGGWDFQALYEIAYQRFMESTDTGVNAFRQYAPSPDVFRRMHVQENNLRFEFSYQVRNAIQNGSGTALIETYNACDPEADADDTSILELVTRNNIIREINIEVARRRNRMLMPPIHSAGQFSVCALCGRLSDQ